MTTIVNPKIPVALCYPLLLLLTLLSLVTELLAHRFMLLEAKVRVGEGVDWRSGEGRDASLGLYGAGYGAAPHFYLLQRHGALMEAKVGKGGGGGER